MKKLTLICVSLFLLTISINAQDITNKLGGTSDAETYDVTDSADKILFRVQGDGKVGIGTITPDEELHIAGNMRLNGAFEDKDGDAGTSGQILSSTATGTDWVASHNLTVLFKNIDYSIQLTDDFIVSTGGNTLTLPLATSASGKIIYLFSSGSTVTLQCSGADAIWDAAGNLGSTDDVLSGIFICDGVDRWYPIN